MVTKSFADRTTIRTTSAELKRHRQRYFAPSGGFDYTHHSHGQNQMFSHAMRPAPDLRAAGVVLAVSGALLVVALFFDWWGQPPAFENPEDLPDDVGFLAASLRDVPDQTENAFEFFEARDLLWLATGILGFAVGLVILTVARVPLAVPAAVMVIALVTGGVLAWTLINPLDYADLAPAGARPIDFGVDLPLGRDVGGYVALAAAVGIFVGSLLAVARLRSRGGRPAAPVRT